MTFDRCSRPWACFIGFIRCSQPSACFVELIRCIRLRACFGELKRRFPFSVAQVWGRTGGDYRGGTLSRSRLTESALGVLKLHTAPTGIYYYEVVSPGPGSAGAPRLTESALGVLKLHWFPTGIYYYEVVSPRSGGDSAPRFLEYGGGAFTWGEAVILQRLHGGKQAATWGICSIYMGETWRKALGSLLAAIAVFFGHS